MSEQQLPARPSLEWLKKSAKDRLAQMRETDPSTRLAHAQLAVAREYGFASWRKLKAHVESLNVGSDDATELLQAIGRDDVGKVRSILERQPDLVNRTGAHPFWGGRPQPLHVAIERGQEEMFRLLLDAGANVDGDNAQYDGWSPLMLSMHWKRCAMSNELLRRGATVDLVGALMLGDDASVARILREDPQALTRPIANRATPLHFARTENAARMLCDAGAAIDARDQRGKTAVDYAASRGTDGLAIARLLVERGAAASPVVYASLGQLDRLRQDQNAATDPQLLHAAAEHGHVEVVRWLLDHGADANARSQTGSHGTPLHSAAWQGHLEVVKVLVDRGADIRAVDEEYKTTPAVWARTALEMLNRQSCRTVVEFLESLKETDLRDRLVTAATNGDASSLRRLLTEHPDMLTTTGGQWDQPLLHLAAWKGHLDAVNALLELGADVNRRDKGDNAYALHFAAEAGHLDVVKRLVEAGGDVHGEGDDHEMGVLGWAVALAGYHEDVAEFLMSKGARLHLFSAISLNRGQDVRRIVAADPSSLVKQMSKNEHRRLPLHHAVIKNRPEMVRLLLELGANVNAADASDATALSYATPRTDPAIVPLLLAAGAKLDLLSLLNLHRYDEAEALLREDPSRIGPDGRDTIALHLSTYRRDADAVKWLIAHGVAVSAKRILWNCNHTALHICAEHDIRDIARLLLEAGADPNVRDDKFDATPLGWATYIKRPEVAKVIEEFAGKS